MRMDELALLIWEAEAGCGVTGLQGTLLNTCVGEVCERLVDEGEGFWRPLARACSFERVERSIERPARKYGSACDHRMFLLHETALRQGVEPLACTVWEEKVGLG